MSYSAAGERRALTVEGEYCSNWTVIDALRELIQNALDTGTKIDIQRLDENTKYIVDKGKGMELSDFLIGRSSKRDSRKLIGQFGEGAPIGCLVLARHGRKVEIASKKKRHSFSFEYDNVWQSSLLTVTTVNDSVKKGTQVFVECSDEEIEQAQSLFMSLTGLKPLWNYADLQIIPEKNTIYVNGLKILNNAGTFFGYNFNGCKELVNRDRGSISSNGLEAYICLILENLDNVSLIASFLEHLPELRNVREINQEFSPVHVKAWKKAIKQVFGEKVCLATIYSTDSCDTRAEEDGYTVLDPPSRAIAWSLAHILPYSDQLKVTHGNPFIPKRQLSKKQKANLQVVRDSANSIARQVGLRTTQIKPFEPSKVDTSMKTVGGFVQKGIVGLSIHLLEPDKLGKAVGVILHEYTHITYGHNDITRDFENDLTFIIENLAKVMLIKKKGGTNAYKGQDN